MLQTVAEGVSNRGTPQRAFTTTILTERHGGRSLQSSVQRAARGAFPTGFGSESGAGVFPTTLFTERHRGRSLQGSDQRAARGRLQQGPVHGAARGRSQQSSGDY